MMIKDKKDKSWFWSKEWQEKERQADEDMKAGRYEEFDTVEELIASLRESVKDENGRK